jgi:tripartite-type tricarboxylate transporter receptor subunit TctC
MFGIARRALALLLFAASASVWAQAYPERPLRLVVGFPPGGSGDFLARIVADELPRELGQSVVVDNKPGAGSTIAAEKLGREAMEPEVSASPEDFAAFVRRDHAMYESIVKSSGAKVE